MNTAYANQRMPRRSIGGLMGLGIKALQAVFLVGLLFLFHHPAAEAAVCGKRYVAGGDHIPAGQDISESERYPNHLIDDHLARYGYCVYNTAQKGTTSSTYISGGQLATTWNRSPDLITLTLGEEDSTIVNVIDSCFDKVKDHDFAGATVCASTILANSSLWSNLSSKLTYIFQQYKMIMAGRPKLVVAVTTYPNPYPSAASATINVPLLCVPLVDTAISCTTRWVQLPLALTAIDQVIQKLNSTIANAAQPFINGTQGRFVLVDLYPKFQSHCMKMDVTIMTAVEHPELDGIVLYWNSSRDFGCSSPWFVEGDTGTETPEYLDPPTTGILIEKTQTTVGMGVRVNDGGQKCIADTIWEADTIEPGVTPLKWKLGVPEPPKTDICQ